MKKILFLGLTLTSLTSSLNAQIIGNAGYMPGYNVSVGVEKNGGYEGADTAAFPATGVIPGLHPRSNTNYLGFTANPQLNNWVTFNGDFFTPGSPENGWGLEMNNGTVNVTPSNNRVGDYDIPGTFTGFQDLNGCVILDWEGDYTDGTYDVHVWIRYQLKKDDLFYTTTVKLYNNGITTIPDLYYYRNVDPDNNVTLTFDYSTSNIIVSQPNSTCGKALVSATQSAPYPSYLGFAAIGPDYRVTYGGFSNRDASDIYFGVSPLTGTTGSQNSGDEAISLAYRKQNLAPGDSTQARFVVILDGSQAENAISSLFYFDYEGGLGAPKPLCSNAVDTALSCIGKQVDIDLVGPNIADFTWTWSPSSTLDTAGGTHVVATPTTTTTYTVTGTPIGGCFTVPIEQQIVVAMDTDNDIEFSIGMVNPNCASNDGSLEVVGLTGGIGPVDIQWEGGPNTALYDNLFSGIYELTLIDSFGCYKDTTLYLENITTLTGSVTLDSMAICDHPSGQITATGANGDPVYMYDIGSGPQASGVFSNLPAGFYMVGISDEDQCLIFEPIEVPDTSLIQISPVLDPETCGGTNGQVAFTVTDGAAPLSFHLDAGPSQPSNTFTGLNSGTYEGFVLDNYGCVDSVTFTITDTNDLVATWVDTVDAVCANPNGEVFVTGANGLGTYTFTLPGHGSQTNGHFTGLTAGPYTMTVTSGTCTTTVPFVVALDPGSLSLAPADITSENCGMLNGIVEVLATGGTTPYAFTIDNFATTQTSPQFIGLNDGVYVIGVEDPNGCIDTVHMYIPEIPIQIDLGEDVIYCNQYTIPGNGVGDYLWSTGFTGHDLTVNQNGDYWLMVSRPGCMDMDTIHVEFIENPIVTPPNVFTPNGDGHNDKFVVDGMFVTTFNMKIYNRWGQLVFETDDITKSWDGTMNGGSDSGEGVYMYIIEFENPCESPSMQSRQGSIQLLR